MHSFQEGQKLWAQKFGKASFSASLKENAGVKAGSSDLDTTEDTDNCKVIIFGLTEKGANRQNRN